MDSLFLFLAFLGGTFLPIQVGINSQLSKIIGSPILAALASFIMGTSVLLVTSLIFRLPFPGWQALYKFPSSLWTGGLFGASIVLFSIIVSPKLGAATLLAFILLGQMSVSLALDHMGYFGFPLQPVSIGRIGGVLLIFLGAFMIKKF